MAVIVIKMLACAWIYGSCGLKNCESLTFNNSYRHKVQGFGMGGVCGRYRRKRPKITSGPRSVESDDIPWFEIKNPARPPLVPRPPLMTYSGRWMFIWLPCYFNTFVLSYEAAYVGCYTGSSKPHYSRLETVFPRGGGHEPIDGCSCLETIKKDN